MFIFYLVAIVLLAVGGVMLFDIETAWGWNVWNCRYRGAEPERTRQ